ncbi:hypothetical protein [Segetibacter koreensis]|uniref:hypothetical protein n=1 Tax=Segetibacter koreensis TaxID=398037 RepID=UPI000373F28B|nr:hypothetical protein [Segetibacter koreensis]
MKTAEQEAKEIVVTVLMKMVCCIEKSRNYLENGIAKEVSLSEVDKTIAITEDENKLKRWKRVRECLEIL